MSIQELMETTHHLSYYSGGNMIWKKIKFKCRHLKVYISEMPLSRNEVNEIVNHLL